MVMAIIYTTVGEYDLAIDELDFVLSVPAWCSINYLKADPLFEPLWELPRFQQLLEKYKKLN